MTIATLLAGIAGACAGLALVETVRLLAARSARPRRHRRVAGPGPLVRLLTSIGRRARLQLPRGGLAARLAAAGDPLGLDPGDLAALKAGGLVVGGVIGVLWASSLPGRLGVALVIAAPAAGFLAPDLALARIARRRAAQMAREAADVLDLLRVAVAAGLPTGRALGEVGRRRGGMLGGELSRTAAQLELGLPRTDAHALLAARAPISQVRALVSALARADRHGAPLAPALTALAAEARADRARLATESAARAAPQIQLIIALVLVPAVMLLVAAALVQGAGGAGGT